MRPPLELPIPTEEEVGTLERLYRSTRDVRLRTRAQIIPLASEQRLAAPAIAAIVRGDAYPDRQFAKIYKVSLPLAARV